MDIISNFVFADCVKGEVAFNSWLSSAEGMSSLKAVLRSHYKLPSGSPIEIKSVGLPNKIPTVNGKNADNIFEVNFGNCTIQILSESAIALDRDHFSRASDYLEDILDRKFDLLIFFYDKIAEPENLFFRNAARYNNLGGVDVVYFKTHYEIEDVVSFVANAKSTSKLRSKILELNRQEDLFSACGEKVLLNEFLERDFGMSTKATQNADDKISCLSLVAYDQDHTETKVKIRYEQKGEGAKMTDQSQVELLRNQLSKLYSGKRYIRSEELNSNDDYVILSDDKKDFNKSKLVKFNLHSKIYDVRALLRRMGSKTFFDALEGYTCDKGSFYCVYFTPRLVQIVKSLKKIGNVN